MNYLIWKSVDALQLLTARDQKSKLSHFVNTHKRYYQTEWAEEDLNSFYIKKYCLEAESCLHTLEDHVFLRQPSKQNFSISVQLIKDVCLQLQQYSDLTSNSKEMSYYCWLNPANIIFNQFSLKPKLKFDAPLYCALGLSSRPLTIENYITQFATP